MFFEELTFFKECKVKPFKNALQCDNRMHKWDVATWLKSSNFFLILQFLFFIVSHGFQAAENVEEFIRQGLVSIGNPDVRHVGACDVISGHPVTSKVWTEPMLFHLQQNQFIMHSNFQTTFVARIL